MYRFLPGTCWILLVVKVLVQGGCPAYYSQGVTHTMYVHENEHLFMLTCLNGVHFNSFQCAFMYTHTHTLTYTLGWYALYTSIEEIFNVVRRLGGWFECR